MSDKPAAPEGAFHAPHVTINRVYTKKGDQGSTALVGGQHVSKDATRIEAYGTVDELGAFVGAARQSAEEAQARAPGLAALAASLLRVQHELFNLGSLLATLPEDVHPRQPRITAADVEALEHEMDAAQVDLPALRSFVLAGGCRLNADLHVARTVCRRAERLVVTLARTEQVDALAVTYLNRLSDALFVWARWGSRLLGSEETLWAPNAAAGARG